MKTWHKIASLLTLLLITGYSFVKLYPALKAVTITPSPTAVTVSITPADATVLGANTTGTCYMRGVLPDSSCTPGVIDPRVTQDNINQTICVTGYTKTVRPSTSYTNQLKVQQIAAYGYPDTNLRDYEEDHLISLELGGSPTDPKNLWPEPGASPNPKDKIENLCHRKICSGQISLKEAQSEISTNWQTACQ